MYAAQYITWPRNQTQTKECKETSHNSVLLIYFMQWSLLFTWRRENLIDPDSDREGGMWIRTGSLLSSSMTTSRTVGSCSITWGTLRSCTYVHVPEIKDDVDWRVEMINQFRSKALYTQNHANWPLSSVWFANMFLHRILARINKF